VPFVRFSRDKRGYEHLYLVDTSRDRGRSRILYWFRSPPGVKVGRNPFDAETQKTLERQNPDVQFDWPQIVAAKIPPPVPVESWREKRRIERAIKRARAEDAVSDVTTDAVSDEPPVEMVEVEGVSALGEAQIEAPPEIFDDPSVEDDGAPDHSAPPEMEIAGAAASPLAATDSASGPVPSSRRRRRRRRRRPRPEGGPTPGASNGQLDPPASDSEASNDE
jgi:hypothetical protein